MKGVVPVRCAFAWLLAPRIGPVFSEQLQQALKGDGILPQRPNFSSSSPLIIHSVFGLLQQWPNTFFPNGHTIAPCTIAKNTNLYHARRDAIFPPSPEWFAFDAAMSYSIAGTNADSHMLTFRTTRNVHCLYFDGTSASMMDDGSMDTQMLLIHNNSAHVPDAPAFRPRPPRNGSYGRPPCGMPGRGYPGDNCTRWNPLQAEYDRAEGLCNLIKEKQLGGLGWGYEGIVRMNAAFELIWCNFSSPSVELVSWLNISSPLLEGREKRRRPWLNQDGENFESTLTYSGRSSVVEISTKRWPDIEHPFKVYGIYEWFHAAAKRYGFVGSVPGRSEARVKIANCGLFSFYDPALLGQERARIAAERDIYNLTKRGYWKAPHNEAHRGEALKKLSRRRRWQRPGNVTVRDGRYMRMAVEDRLRAALAQNADACSGIDWGLLVQELVAFYSSDIHRLTALVSSPETPNGTALRARLAQVREVVHSLWMPFYEYPLFAEDTLEQAFSLAAPESRAAIRRCSSQHQPVNMSELLPSEQTISDAIAEVLSVICGALLPIFLSVEHIWFAHFNNVSQPPPPPASPAYAQLHRALHDHRHALGELTAWLGWADQWTACRPGCDMGQVCFIPMWPTAINMGLGRGVDDGRRTRNDAKYMYHSPRPGWDQFAQDEYLWEPKCVDPEHYPPG